MATSPHDYVFDSAAECERLEHQATLLNFDRHLRLFRASRGSRILDAGSGSGAVAREIARRHPDA